MTDPLLDAMFNPSPPNEVSEEEEGIIIAGHSLKKLIESPHWETYTTALLRNIELREKQLLAKPITGVEDVLAAEREKGTINGIRLCLSMPIATVEEMKRLNEIKYGPMEDER